MKKLIKGLFKLSLFLIALGVIFQYKEEINTFYIEHFAPRNEFVKLDFRNKYYRDFKYNYVKLTNDFLIKDKNQIIDVYYTIINSGISEFTFYCSKEYKTCIDDVVEVANNQIILSNINSFVHPYNSFSSIETKYDTLGKITLKINKSYTSREISEINEKVEDIVKNQVKNQSDKKQIIKIIHDYIINNSKNDSEKSDKNIDKYKSNIAYGPLLQGYGLCGGYTDSMAIFLDYYEIPNFKVISENHIWNAVYLNDNWYHLDLTWDDPVVSDGSNVLEYNFFLINNTELEKLNTNQHEFDKEVFKEMLTNTNKNI